MAFLALVQGYALLATPLVTITQGLAVAAVVGGATAATAYALEHRLADRAARRASDETESRDADDKSKS